MDKIFLDYNTCKRLKNLGFKEKCIAYYYTFDEQNVFHGKYDERGKFYFTEGLNEEEYNINSDKTYYISALTYEQCLNFLRTKYFINIKIEYLCSVNEILALVGVIDFMINKYEKPDIHINSNSLDYYEVLTETINETLDIIEKWKM